MKVAIADRSTVRARRIDGTPPGLRMRVIAMRFHDAGLRMSPRARLRRRGGD
jgi:hypothetical protein